MHWVCFCLSALLQANMALTDGCVTEAVVYLDVTQGIYIYIYISGTPKRTPGTYTHQHYKGALYTLTKNQ